MIDKLKYVNSNNQTLEIGENGIFLNYTDLRDFGTDTASLPFVLITDKESQDNFFEHFEVDSQNDKNGYFEINGYRKSAKMVSASNAAYLETEKKLYTTLSFEFFEQNWIKEQINSFLPEKPSSNFLIVGTKIYPYKYPYRYSKEEGEASLMNNSDFAQNAIIKLYGSDSNPYIQIGENIYQVNIDVESGSHLEINTKEKTVNRVTAAGTKVNAYGNRNTNFNIFEKIKPGENKVFWNSDKIAEVILLEERGQPKWKAV